MMIGQKSLLSKLNSFTMSSLPHSMLLVGEEGSEQDEVIDFICDKFNLTKYETSNIDAKFIKQIILDLEKSLSPTLCVLDFNAIMRSQDPKIYFNMLLKLFEEPNAYTYVMLVCNSIDFVPETIATRSYILNCDKYQKTDLVPLVRGKELEETRLTLEICHTPGQVEVANHCNIQLLYDECNCLKESLQTMLAYEVLEYSNKINFSDNYDKYDLKLFTKMLKYVIIDKYRLYKDIVNFEKHIDQMYVIGKMNGKQCYFDNLMLKLWEDSKNGH